MLNTWMILIALFGIIKERSVTSTDPCQEGNHRVLTNLGSRNEWCVPSGIPLEDLLCDQYLPAGWYTASNALMLNRAPVNGTCGVDNAAWLKDPFPNAGDGIVNRTICVMDAQDTCLVDFRIQIKHCSTFYVYYMTPLPDTVGCPAAYCFNSQMTCFGVPMSSTTSSNPTSFLPSSGQTTFTPTIKSMSSSVYNKSVTSTVFHNPSSQPSSLISSTPEVGGINNNNESGQQNNQVAIYALSASLAVSICIIAVLVVIHCCVLKRRKSEGADSDQGDYTQPSVHATTSNIYATLDQDQAKMKGADSYQGNPIPRNAHATTGNIYYTLDQDQS